MGKAMSLFKLNHYEEAISQFNTILTIEPYNHEAFNYIGSSYLLIEKFKSLFLHTSIINNVWYIFT